MEAREPLPIDALPPEVLCRILMHLPAKDRLQCRLVSKKWGELGFEIPDENKLRFMEADEYIARFKLCRLLCLIFDIPAGWLANETKFDKTFSTLMKDSYYIFNIEYLARQLVLLNEIRLFVKSYAPYPRSNNYITTAVRPLRRSLTFNLLKENVHAHAPWESIQKSFNDFLDSYKTNDRDERRSKILRELTYIKSLINNPLTLFNKLSTKEIFNELSELFLNIDPNYKGIIENGRVNTSLLSYRHSYSKDKYENRVIGTWLNHNDSARDSYLHFMNEFTGSYDLCFRTTHNDQPDLFFAPVQPRPPSITDSSIFNPYGPSYWLYNKMEYWFGACGIFYESSVDKVAKGGEYLGKFVHGGKVGKVLGSIVGHTIFFPPAFLVGLIFFTSLLAAQVIVAIAEAIIRGIEIGIKAVALGCMSLFHCISPAKEVSQPLLEEQHSSQYTDEPKEDRSELDIESQTEVLCPERDRGKEKEEEEKEKEKEKEPFSFFPAHRQANANDLLKEPTVSRYTRG